MHITKVYSHHLPGLPIEKFSSTLSTFASMSVMRIVFAWTWATHAIAANTDSKSFMFIVFICCF
jgi:hypothetical protein